VISDRRLVRAFRKRGDEESFRTLYRRHSPAIYRVAWRMVGGDESLAEDVLQETWLRASDSLSGFAWRSSLRTWLIGIAVNAARESLRARDPGSGDIASIGDPARAAPASQVDLERALTLLPQGFREVLLLHDVEGYTHREIARFLDIAEGTSKSQLSRARSAVRSLMEERKASNEPTGE